MRFRQALLAAALALAAPLSAGGAQPAAAPAAAQSRWSEAQANAWYARQPCIVGANFLPSTAVNELVMWQAATFDPVTIDRELGFAQSIGMNTARIFLHDLLYAQDPPGFLRRIDQVLAIADRHHIRPVLVLFDSCWDPDPHLGPQPAPVFGVHNSRWVQSPGRRDLVDPAQRPRLLAYVRGVVGRFARDPRVLMWDIWNEPDNDGGGAYNPLQLPGEKAAIAELLPQAFAVARAAGATQPLTSPLWTGDHWERGSADLNPIQRVQIEQSDLISIHDYSWPETFERRVTQAKTYGRPVIVTEWMARAAGSTVDTILPLGKRLGVAMINWGLVDGKDQTRLPWESWSHPYVTEAPPIWFHDLLHADGTPYRAREVQIFRDLTGAPAR